MADSSELFEKYYQAISLTQSRRDDLTTSRDALRDKVRVHFSNVRKEVPPQFYGQGSFYMRTIVNPVGGRRYDIDDGVYLKNIDSNQANWPKAENVHQWICDAIHGKTDKPIVDKDTCVRAIYSGGKISEGYHVDLPIYGVVGEKAFLAVKGQQQWVESDPLEFRRWFDGKRALHGNQLRRNVCYLKAWGDYHRGEFKVLKGIAATVLVAESQLGCSRDDMAFVDTTANVTNYLRKERRVRKPVAPGENLLSKWSDDQIDNLIARLDALVSDGRRAIAPDADERTASQIWKKQFGNRFPEAGPPGDSGGEGPTPVPLGYTPKKKESPNIGGGRFACHLNRWQFLSS